jgi:hypothetical protein
MGQTEMDKEGTLFQTRQTLAWEDGFPSAEAVCALAVWNQVSDWMMGAG